MTSGHWKQFERDCGALIGGKRYPANMGDRVDVEGLTILGQCKLTKNLSHQALSDLAIEMEVAATLKNKLGVVLHKVPGGQGKKTPGLVTMTFHQFLLWKEIYGRHEAK